MIVFLLVVVISILGTWHSHWYEAKHPCDTSPLVFLGGIIGIFGSIVAVIMLVCAIVDNATAQEAYATNMAEYEGLTYIAENIEEEYLDDFDIRKADVVNKILEWNIKVVSHKEMCDSIWVGMFYPDFWKDVPTIEYSLLKGD